MPGLSRRPLLRGCALALLLPLLAGCAPARSPGAASASLAERVAPDEVWEPVREPLETLLRDRKATVLMPFGEESARCTLHQEAAATLTCGQVDLVEPDLDTLLRAVNRGDLHVALTVRRLSEPEMFQEATFVRMERPLEPLQSRSGTIVLAEPYGEVQVSVGPHGEVTARLGDDEAPLVLEAGGVWGLGGKLRGAEDEARKARRPLAQALKVLLAPLRLPPAQAGYGSQTLGAPLADLASDERSLTKLPYGILSRVNVSVVSGRVAHLSRMVTTRNDTSESCEVLDELVKRRSGLTLRSGDPQAYAGCAWSQTGPGFDLLIEVNYNVLSLRFSVSYGRLLELERLGATQKR